MCDEKDKQNLFFFLSVRNFKTFRETDLGVLWVSVGTLLWNKVELPEPLSLSQAGDTRPGTETGVALPWGAGLYFVEIWGEPHLTPAG